MQGLLKNLRRAAKVADLIEIRADSIRDFSLPLLLRQKTSKPLIFTCYSKASGGHFSGAESERTKLLSSAISSKMFEYVTIDIPESLKIPKSTKTLIDLGRRCQTKTILTYHNYRRTPDNLEAIYKKMAAYLPERPNSRAGKPDVVKIVTYARTFSDNFKIFKLARKVASQKLAPKRPAHKGEARHRRHGALMAPPKLIAFCMGDKGLISRILYKKFGLFLTYASYKTGLETGAGQIPFEQMKYLYRSDGINSRTKIFGLLGNPIKHSYGPVLFNGLFRVGKLNAVYLPLDVEPGYFRRDFSLIKSFLKPAGFSITSPYKITAMKSTDRLSSAAKEIKAINTIYQKGDKFIGTNTDWIGVIEALSPLRKLLKDRQAFILGRGGASRAIVYALRNLLALPSGNAQRHASLSSGIKTVVFSRNPGKGVLSLRRLPQYCKGSGADKIIINATPVGMFPDTDRSPVPKSCLKKGMIVFDTIYNPAETRLLKDARSKGCIAVNGLRMFLAQALKQMEYFIRNVR